MTRKVPESEAACFQLIEDKLFKGPWVLGEAYSICDAYLFTLAGWLEGDGVDPRRFPKCHAHPQRVTARPPVRTVLSEEGASGRSPRKKLAAEPPFGKIES